MDTNPALTSRKFTNQGQGGSSCITPTLILSTFSIDSCVPHGKKWCRYYVFISLWRKQAQGKKSEFYPTKASEEFGILGLSLQQHTVLSSKVTEGTYRGGNSMYKSRFKIHYEERDRDIVFLYLRHSKATSFQ